MYLLVSKTKKLTLKEKYQKVKNARDPYLGCPTLLHENKHDGTILPHVIGHVIYLNLQIMKI